MKTKELERAHGYLAAEQLLADLRAQEELSVYVLPEVWRRRDQVSAIAALGSRERVCVVVGRSENSLPEAGDMKQGGLLRVGLAVYVFQPHDGVTEPDGELPERVMLTVLKYANRFYYHPGGMAGGIKARLRNIQEVDVGELAAAFAAEVRVEALTLEVALRLG